MRTPSFETIDTDYLEYKGATALELGFGPDAVKGEYFEHINDNGQRLGIYESRPKGPNGELLLTDRTIIIPASHDYRLEPLWMTRGDEIASSAQARVILVETPGTVGLLHATENGGWEVYPDKKRLKGAFQTLPQAFGAMHGDFTEHSKVKIDAIELTVGLDINERITILGESLGASSCYLLEELYKRGYNVEEVILYEDVSPGRGYDITVPIKMLGALKKENVRRNDYFEENNAIGHEIKAFELVSAEQKKLDSARKGITQQAFASIVNGAGVGQGRIGLLDKVVFSLIPRDEQPRYTLVRGEQSLATHQADYQDLANFIAERNGMPRLFNVRDVGSGIPIGHFHSVSLARQKQVADKLFQDSLNN